MRIDQALGNTYFVRGGNRMRVAEIFGPTIQGEGIGIGTKTYFIRFAGCDNRCSWCDTGYAQVVSGYPEYTVDEILARLDLAKASHVVLTGGNPCIYDLSELVGALKCAGFYVTVETQGTRWQEWLSAVDFVTISPKGPSSGCKTPLDSLERFAELEAMVFKVVIFGKQDLNYARTLTKLYPERLLVLQVGTSLTNPSSEELLDTTRRLVEQVLQDNDFRDVIILPQLHVLLWGNKRGV